MFIDTHFLLERNLFRNYDDDDDNYDDCNDTKALKKMTYCSTICNDLDLPGSMNSNLLGNVLLSRRLRKTMPMNMALIMRSRHDTRPRNML
jgi:hypothetical protein